MKTMDDDNVMIALTTVAGAEDADRMAATLVGERLAACVNVTAVRSTYRWQGGVEVEEERLLVIKTTRARWPELRRRLPELHEYDVPELVALDVADGLDPYLDWVASSCSVAASDPSPES